MLCGAAIISLVLAAAYERTATAYAEGSAIIIAILAVTNVAAINDWRKQRQFDRLNRKVEDVSIRVIRDGVKQEISINDIVVGDVVTVGVGDIICADGVVIESSALYCDESSLTGEPVLMAKDPDFYPFLLSGTKVMDGSGMFLVVAVGPNSEAGKIKSLINGGMAKPKKSSSADATAEEDEEEEEPEVVTEHEEKSVLTAKLDRMALQIGKAGTIVAVLCVIIMAIRFSITKFVITDNTEICLTMEDVTCSSQKVIDIVGNNVCNAADPNQNDLIAMRYNWSAPPCGWMTPFLGQMLQFFITGITILHFAVTKMQKDNNLVKHLDACETMGSATTICSDKTGTCGTLSPPGQFASVFPIAKRFRTLTKNRMTVVEANLAGVEIQPADGRKFNPLPSSEIQSILLEGIALNTTADIKWDPLARAYDQAGYATTARGSALVLGQIGNKTECALLQLVEQFGGSYETLRAQAMDSGLGGNKSGRQRFLVHEIPFSSARKRSSVVVRTKEGKYRMYMKGASEIILDLCGSYELAGGAAVPKYLDKRARQVINTIITLYARKALRTVGLAYRDFDTEPEGGWDQLLGDADDRYQIESDLVFLGVVGIEDPLRDEVAIARGCGILRPGIDLDKTGVPVPGAAMTGPKFRKMVLQEDGCTIDHEAFDRVWPRLRVLARSSPSDKYVLVSGLNESELYSTEAGVNLGIYPDRQVVAVTGISGTAVAKDAADIILMDDNFSSILKACMWGRNVYDSISKFLQFQLTVNISAITMASIGALAYSESPLKAVQMLWVNLIMDALASLSLATEPPTASLLDRPPYGRNTSLISGFMLWNMLGQATYQLIVLNIILFGCPSMFGMPSGAGLGHGAAPTDHYTIIFNTFVLMQLTNQINARKLYHQWNLFGGITRSPLFIAIVSVEFGLQVLIVQFGGEWFKTKSLDWSEWAMCLVLGLGSFPMQYLIILLARASRHCCRRISPEMPQHHARKQAEGLANELDWSSAKGGGDDLDHFKAASHHESLASVISRSIVQFSSKSLGSVMGETPSESDLQHTTRGGFRNKRRVEATHKMAKESSTMGARDREE
ncbi:hypothetical protein FOZ60_005528 [Perkinsus olseni]|uniref:P-type Ca(2+) transporter n=1 Tax=Perkinsus olseni TaxID=32597 RepID=A0A7J6PG80_PEROL|nr:hypothetical protein FOZ60_005528 [Perkinsus olseni]